MPATITVTDLGGGDFFLKIDETLVANATEVPILLATYGLPSKFRIYQQSAQLTTGGTATTIDPILMKESGAVGDSTKVICENDTPSANPSNNVLPAIRAIASGPSIFHRAQPNNFLTADATVSTIYHFRRGWEG